MGCSRPPTNRHHLLPSGHRLTPNHCRVSSNRRPLPPNRRWLPPNHRRQTLENCAKPSGKNAGISVPADDGPPGTASCCSRMGTHNPCSVRFGYVSFSGIHVYQLGLNPLAWGHHPLAGAANPTCAATNDNGTRHWVMALNLSLTPVGDAWPRCTYTTRYTRTDTAPVASTVCDSTSTLPMATPGPTTIQLIANRGAAQRRALQYNGKQSTATHCEFTALYSHATSLQCAAMHWNAMTMPCSALQCTLLHGTAVQCIAFHLQPKISPWQSTENSRKMGQCIRCPVIATPKYVGTTTYLREMESIEKSTAFQQKINHGVVKPI